MRGTLRERFEDKVDRSAGTDGCHLWTGAKVPNGYGSIGTVVIDGRKRTQVGAHRVAFYLASGYWPNVARHTCDVKLCCNPRHLLDGTVRDNALDWAERGETSPRRRTHCPQGHEYDAANTRTNRLGHRQCRACNRANAQRQAERQRSADPEAFKARAAARQRAYQARKR